jgi:hypothetical protein
MHQAACLQTYSPSASCSHLLPAILVYTDTLPWSIAILMKIKGNALFWTHSIDSVTQYWQQHYARHAQYSCKSNAGA